MRVLHLPTAVGGNAWNLSQGERALGVESKVLNIGENCFGFKYDIKKDWQKNKFTYPIKAIRFYKKELKNYDILHFNFGRTLFNYQNSLINMLDLPFIKRSGVKIVVTYQGSDARLAGFCLNNYDVNFYKHYPSWKLKEELKKDKIKIRKIKKMNKYADQIYATNPDLLNVLPKRTVFRPYTKLQIEEWSPVYSDYSKPKLIIAHAPTNRLIKGTEVVIKCLNEMINNGSPIELMLIENMTNNEAVENLKKADIVIDQLYAGWYGGLAVEAMALGKPVITYIRESDIIHVPKEMAEELPIINATDYNLTEVIDKLLNNRSELPKIAKASRKYVERWHDSKKNAKYVVDNYKKILNTDS